MPPADTIRRKRDGRELGGDELRAFAEAAARGTWPDYQLAALLMAITLKGMTPAETAALTAAMADSGVRVNLDSVPGVKVDKHSTGGVGDKTSLVLAPLAAACGVVVPMMSGRGLGHTGGTLDKLEAIPGFRIDLSLDEFRAALKEVGVAMVGQTAEVAPADRKLYALRDVTATVESIPLITASILSKKLAEGISGLVLDVKCGAGAFMPTLETARELAESLVTVGRANGLNVEALLTAMDAPLGRAVGNALEVAECVDILNPASGRGPDDLSELCVLLAARMVRLAGVADDAGAEARVREVLHSGKGLDVFRRLVARQGGDPRLADDPWAVLPRAPHTFEVPASRDGFVAAIDARAVGVAAMRLGAGRAAAEDRVDPAVGVEVLARVGTRVESGETLFRVHYRGDDTLSAALDRLEVAATVADVAPPPAPLVLGEIR